MRERDGFTLVEVLVASIIFFMAVAVLSQLFGMGAGRVERLDRKITGSIRVLNKVVSYIDGEDEGERKTFEVVVNGNETKEVTLRVLKLGDNETLVLPK